MSDEREFSKEFLYFFYHKHYYDDYNFPIFKDYITPDKQKIEPLGKNILNKYKFISRKVKYGN